MNWVRRGKGLVGPTLPTGRSGDTQMTVYSRSSARPPFTTKGSDVIINKNSWHYRFIAAGWREHPKSLCGYFWKIAFNGLAIITGAAIVIFAILVGLALMLYLVWGWFTEFNLGTAIASITIWAVVLIAAAPHVRDWYHSRWGANAEPSPEKPPGLVASYLAAKYRKVCPLVEYRNDEGPA